MAAVPMTHGLIVAGALFSLGLVGVLVRRNIIFILMSIEVMLNAAGLAFVVAGARWGASRRADHVPLHPDDGRRRGRRSASRSLLLFYHRFGTLDADAASMLRG